MSKLKEFRLRLGMTQAELAASVETTQQSIARWEAGKTPIPTVQLRNLAVFLGTSVDSLLKAEQSDKTLTSFLGRGGTPWGTVKLFLSIGAKEYPIADVTRKRLTELLSPGQAAPRWVTFETLDNLAVWVNTTALRGADFVDDDYDGMPGFFSEETYAALTASPEPIEEAGLLIEETGRAAAALATLSGRDHTAETAREAAHEFLLTLRVFDHDGKLEVFFLDDQAATALLQLEAFNEDKKRFVQFENDLGVQKFRCMDSIALIEAPLKRFVDLLSEDHDK